MLTHIPAAFERILQCLHAEKEPLSWNISKSFKGQFSLRIWASQEVPAFPNKGRKSKHSHFSHAFSPTNVDTNTDSKVKNANAVIPDHKKPESTGKRTKTPSRIRRDKARRASWSLQKKLSRQNLRATERLSEQRRLEQSDPPSDSRSTVSSPERLENIPEVLESDGTLETSTILEPTEKRDLCLVSSPRECTNANVHPDNSTSSVPSLSEGNTNLDHSATSSETEAAGNNTLDDIFSGVCDNCFKEIGPGVTPRLCTKCKVVKYCSVKCQKKQWTEHKKLCIDFVYP